MIKKEQNDFTNSTKSLELARWKNLKGTTGPKKWPNEKYPYNNRKKITE